MSKDSARLTKILHKNQEDLAVVADMLELQQDLPLEPMAILLAEDSSWDPQIWDHILDSVITAVQWYPFHVSEDLKDWTDHYLFAHQNEFRKRGTDI